jgi:hypothetical protein
MNRSIYEMSSRYHVMALRLLFAIALTLIYESVSIVVLNRTPVVVGVKTKVLVEREMIGGELF